MTSQRRNTEVNPGDIWELGYEDDKYRIIGTAIMRGDKYKNVTELAIVYRRAYHPLICVMERIEFIKKFRWVSRGKKNED